MPASESPATTTAKTSKEDKASGSQASLPNPAAAEAVLVREEVEEEKEEAEEEREEAEEKKEEVEDQTEVLVGDKQGKYKMFLLFFLVRCRGSYRSAV